MQQLGGLDSAWLALESPQTPMHIASLVLLDPRELPGGLTMKRVRALFEQRLHLIPPLRRKLVSVPGNLDHPYWIEDPDFDLGFHLRHRGLPKPGTKKQLEDLVVQIFARPLDRSRPLWEAYLIEGVEKGKVAFLMKMHHACIDGVSGQDYLVHLLDREPNPPAPQRAASAWRPDATPTPAQMLGRALAGLAQQPLRAFEILPYTLSTAFDLGRGLLGGGGERPKSPFAAPPSFLNKPLTPHRSWAFTSLSLADAKAVKDAFGVKLNDVVLAICATALRGYGLQKGQLPDEPLLAAVPVSVEGARIAGARQAGDSISFLFCPLATDIDDPLERLRAISESAAAAGSGTRPIGADQLQDWGRFAAPAVMARAGQALSRLAASGRVRPPFNLAIANVPGPRETLYWAGAKVAAIYPLSLTFEGAGFNITVMSYRDSLDFGLTADRGTLPDVWQFAESLEQAMALYRRLAGGKAAARGQQASRRKAAGGKAKS